MRVVVSPHFDDADLGASMVLGPGCAVVVVAGTDEERYREQLASARTFNLDEVVRGDAEDGYVLHDVDLVQLIERETQYADVVFCPPVLDTHQDHSAVARASVSALRRTARSLIEYETPSATSEWTPNLWMPMTEDDIVRQMDALRCHYSQSNRPYMTRRWVETRAAFRGQQIGIPYAQAFRVVRSVANAQEYWA